MTPKRSVGPSQYGIAETDHTQGAHFHCLPSSQAKPANLTPVAHLLAAQELITWRPIVSITLNLSCKRLH
eukprot:6880350-Karenia_brevis.AAC.1